MIFLFYLTHFDQMVFGFDADIPAKFLAIYNFTPYFAPGRHCLGYEFSGGSDV